MEGPFESPLARPGGPGMGFYSENQFFQNLVKKKNNICKWRVRLRAQWINQLDQAWREREIKQAELQVVRLRAQWLNQLDQGWSKKGEVKQAEMGSVRLRAEWLNQLDQGNIREDVFFVRNSGMSVRDFIGCLM